MFVLACVSILCASLEIFHTAIFSEFKNFNDLCRLVVSIFVIVLHLLIIVGIQKQQPNCYVPYMLSAVKLVLYLSFFRLFSLIYKFLTLNSFPQYFSGLCDHDSGRELANFVVLLIKFGRNNQWTWTTTEYRLSFLFIKLLQNESFLIIKVFCFKF